MINSDITSTTNEDEKRRRYWEKYAMHRNRRDIFRHVEQVAFE